MNLKHQTRANTRLRQKRCRGTIERNAFLLSSDREKNCTVGEDGGAEEGAEVPARRERGRIGEVAVLRAECGSGSHREDGHVTWNE